MRLQVNCDQIFHSVFPIYFVSDILLFYRSLQNELEHNEDFLRKMFSALVCNNFWNITFFG